MHPITYSLLLNLPALIIGGLLSWFFANPLVFVCALILATHIPTKHRRDEQDDEDDERSEYSDSKAGFTGKVS